MPCLISFCLLETFTLTILVSLNIFVYKMSNLFMIKFRYSVYGYWLEGIVVQWIVFIFVCLRLMKQTIYCIYTCHWKLKIIFINLETDGLAGNASDQECLHMWLYEVLKLRGSLMILRFWSRWQYRNTFSNHFVTWN